MAVIKISKNNFASTTIAAIICCSKILMLTEAYKTSYAVNDRPIIGIMTQEVYPTKYSYQNEIICGDCGGGGVPTTSYIAASYVKFLEGAGARVVPIMVNKDETYLREMFNSINGILFPGGAIYFGNDTTYNHGFYKSALFLYNLAKEANDAGDYFPLWGTCLGFEFMLFAAAGSKEYRVPCGAWNALEKLKFTPEARKSSLFGKAPKSIVKSLQSKQLAANFHHYCATPTNFTQNGLDKHYKILTTNYDASSQLEYISSVESLIYPFYAVQFHPEKNIYEWTTKEKVPHSIEAVQAGQYFANFFVNEARKSQHRFKSEDEELRSLIYNFNPSFTGKNGSAFLQEYIFPF